MKSKNNEIDLLIKYITNNIKRAKSSSTWLSEMNMLSWNQNKYYESLDKDLKNEEEK